MAEHNGYTKRVGNYVILHEGKQWSVKPISDKMDFIKYFTTPDEAIRFSEIMTNLDKEISEIRRNSFK